MKIIHIKQMTPALCVKLSQLISECRAIDGSEIPTYPDIIQRVRELPSQLLCFEDDRLVGFLSLYFFYEHACELSVMVAPAYRRRKIATALLNTIKPLLEKAHMDQLIFSAPAKCNDSWFRKKGFVYQYSEYEMLRDSPQPESLSQPFLLVREATREDIPMLCDLDAAGFQSDQTTMQERFLQLITDPQYHIYIAEEKGRSIGKAHLKWEKEGARLSDIVVYPAEQKKGYGSSLIAYLINTIIPKQQKITLTVETNNEQALKCYTRLRFNIVNACDFWSFAP